MRRLPMVFPSNRRTQARELDKEFPGRVGLLHSLDGWVDPAGLPYALDNGRYPCYSAGKPWDEGKYRKLLARPGKVGYPPAWAAVPDVVGDRAATLREWGRWHPELKQLGVPLALVVQDGMSTSLVRAVRPAPDVVFVGGTTRWKWATAFYWCREFPRVHVGRVNTLKLLWLCHRVGAESTDGTGWFHEDTGQADDLRTYLRKSQAGHAPARGLFF